MLISAVVASSLVAAMPSESCDFDALAAGMCATAGVVGDRVTIGGERQGADGSAGPRLPDRPRETAPRDCGPLGRCDHFTVSILPQATLTDVASFAPAPAALSGEPAGQAVAGLPHNFLVAASEHVASGTLFDLPVTVRFTPDEVIVAPGDGAVVASPTGGRSWSELGARAFSATATSHVYAARGSYTATAVMRYRADVDFGRGWRPVPGLLDIPTAAYPVEVVEARATLVERTCGEAPRGPGC